MSLNPRTPVIIGVGQTAHAPSTDREIRDAADSIALMAEAVDAAIADSGATAVRDRIDTVAVVGGLWRYRDPASLVAREIGLAPSRTIHSSMGGNIPIHLLGVLSDRILAGELDLAVLTCGENNLSRRAQKRAGIDMPRRPETGETGVESFGSALDMGDSNAAGRGGEMPRNSYAVFESALRVKRGESLDESRDRAAKTWAGFAAVAADNPFAADRRSMTATQIREATADNRFVSWPYTKAMCANNTVDHGAAIIVASTEIADQLAITPDRRVYPRQCVTAADTTSLLQRHDLATAPGLAAAADVMRSMVGDLDTLDHFDLYSCFPSIVALTTELFGISPDRVLTVTGGLAFAGAPLNFAAGESVVGMVRRLRDDAGAVGLVQGNGGHTAKHALATYSTTPPPTFHTVVTTDHGAPSRLVADPDTSGTASVDGVTVDYDHSGPSRAIGIVRFPNGSRTWATSADADLMRTCTEVECVGREVEVDNGLFRF